MKRCCNNTSIPSTARIKSRLNFYPFKQQMPFLKELKQKAKLATNCPKCNPRASKLKYFSWEASHTLPGGALLPHLPRLSTVCQDGGFAPIFGPCYCKNCPGYLKPEQKPCIIVLKQSGCMYACMYTYCVTYICICV